MLKRYLRWEDAALKAIRRTGKRKSVARYLVERMIKRLRKAEDTAAKARVMIPAAAVEVLANSPKAQIEAQVRLAEQEAEAGAMMAEAHATRLRNLAKHYAATRTAARASGWLELAEAQAILWREYAEFCAPGRWPPDLAKIYSTL